MRLQGLTSSKLGAVAEVLGDALADQVDEELGPAAVVAVRLVVDVVVSTGDASELLSVEARSTFGDRGTPVQGVAPAARGGETAGGGSPPGCTGSIFSRSWTCLHGVTYTGTGDFLSGARNAHGAGRCVKPQPEVDLPLAGRPSADFRGCVE